MNLKGNTVLITGGSTGIGLALAVAFLSHDNEVIVCSRTEDNLRKAEAAHPGLRTRRCDLSNENERERFHDWVVSNYPDINVLINNAGIQRMIDLRNGTKDIVENLAVDHEDEIDVNFKAYVYMAAHFIPHLLSKKEAAIVNVSSGLGFVPIASMPIYCATKAAVHSFTVSLRHQLKGSNIRVFEVIPPIVDTDLDKGARGRRGQVDRGIPPEEVAIATLSAMGLEQFEIVVGMAQRIVMGSRSDFDLMFSRMNG